MNNSFINALQDRNWQEVAYDWEYKRDGYKIYRDTSNWWMLCFEDGTRVFDIPETESVNLIWIMNLIDFICRISTNSTLC
jgi:hypothetical protein